MFFKKKEKSKETTSVIVDRQKMLSEEPRAHTGYCADFEMCQFCFDYLKKAFAETSSSMTNHEIEDRSLSERNLACMRNAMVAFRENDSRSYWHEVADFIHNYNRKAPVSYAEYQVYAELFKLGLQTMGDSETPAAI